MPRGRPVRLLCATTLTLGTLLAAAPAALAGEVVPADTVGPAVVSLTVAPGAVDASTGAAQVVVTARLADAGSGVTGASVRLVAADAAPAPLTLLSGDASDGVWTATATVAAYAPHGAAAAFVDGTDAAGNVATATLDAAVQVADARPAAPAAVAASPVDGVPGAVRVTWADPPANGGSAVTGFDVTAAPADAAQPAPAPVTAAAGTHEAVLSGLADGAAYAVSVTASNAAGTGPAGVADAVMAASVATVPGVPLAVAAAPADRGLDVTWTPPATDGGARVTGYRVRVSSPAVTAPEALLVPADTSGVRVDGLLNGMAYDVAVTALNTVGSGASATVRATPRTVPGAPGIGTVTAGDRSAVVRWTAPASDGGAPVTAYLVTDVASGAVHAVAGSARSATVGGLPNGVTTAFAVTAVNAAGRSAASAQSVAVTPRQAVRLAVVAQPAPTVVYGTASVVRAALRTATGTGLPLMRVELLAQTAPSTAWTRVASGTTDGTGQVTLRAVLPANSALRLHHPANAVAAPDVAVRSVGVGPRVTARASATRIKVGKTLTVTGGVTPAHPVGSLVRLQRWTGSAWTDTATGRMTTTTSYRITWKATSRGAWNMRVVKLADRDHVANATAAWRQQVDPENAADIATAIRGNTRISLDTRHTSGVVDAATARQNIVDLSYGRLARRSSYENAPGGSTAVDPRLLAALRRMGVLGRVTVSEIAGGSHSRGSLHYSGRGLDIREVNGVPVRRGSGYGMAVDVCRAFGASRVFHPSYDPYGGHGGHVHCDW